MIPYVFPDPKTFLQCGVYVLLSCLSLTRMEIDSERLDQVFHLYIFGCIILGR